MRLLSKRTSPLVSSRAGSLFVLAFALAVGFASAISSCGSGTAAGPVSVSISPTTATVAPGATQQFTATVSGNSNGSVTWLVDGAEGGSASSGTITTAGLYTAPSSTGTHTVTARSTADTSKSASATVTIASTSTIQVAVSPSSASIVAGATQQFTATVTGSSNTGVTWSVDGVSGGNTNVGTITSSGLYTAPAAAGSHTVTAISAADSTVSGSATVTVTGGVAVAVSVSPAAPTVVAGATQQFSATVTGSSNTAVTWSVDGTVGGSASAGTITTGGLYTAPSAAGTHTVTATSVADATASGSATVTVQVPVVPSSGDVTVDFNLRTGGSALPAGLFGSQLGSMSDVNNMKTLVASGLTGTRIYANVQSVFATQTPNWTLIDSTLDKLSQAGMKAILMVANTPTWLQPSPNPCSDSYPIAHNAQPYNAAPTDNSAYASIAAQYVAHIDQKYPGLVAYYEVWNEADEANQFCGLNSGDWQLDQTRLDEYKALYKAVATAMKAQAAHDGVSIMVGGPALGNSNGSDYWLQQLVQVTNNGAHIVDFVSYHQYLAGSDVSHTMTWDGAGGTPSLYSRTLDTNTGIAAVYTKAAQAAASAGYTVPVIYDEFNEDWDFYNDCCKNNPTYSSLWNSMVVALVFNTVYSGAPPIQHLSYYSAMNQPFCLLGNPDNGAYDCGTMGTQLPYPQFRAFELFASSSFLGLQASGGNMAKSVATTSAMSSAGLIATAFYTPGSDAILLINPKGTAINNAVVVLGNHGLNNPQATQFLLNGTTYSPNAPVAGSPLTLSTSGSNGVVTVTVPPYSVLAIKITGQ